MSLSFNLSLPTVRETTGTKCLAPADVMKELAELRTAAQECFCVITLDTKNRIIDKHLVTLGILNASLAHPREVFRAAIMDAARPRIAIEHILDLSPRIPSYDSHDVSPYCMRVIFPVEPSPTRVRPRFTDHG